MARFRRGHERPSRGGIRLWVLVIGVLIAVACMIMVRKLVVVQSPQVILFEPDDEPEFLPSAAGGQVVRHQYYTLSYLEDLEQAQWVAYTLTKSQLDQMRVPRGDWFYTDVDISTGSAEYRDYSNSGYSRGHLVPAADMAFDTTAMRESFYMSNISPQRRAFNGGIWRELEEQVRDWVWAFDGLYIVSGPVFTGPVEERIGAHEVAVPNAFYKVLYDAASDPQKGIAFVIPNTLSDAPLMSYAVTIDRVEEMTGIDFFEGLSIEPIEASVDTQLWQVDVYRYQMRVSDWNYR